jgi:hypothetical protein
MRLNFNHWQNKILAVTVTVTVTGTARVLTAQASDSAAGADRRPVMNWGSWTPGP